ncbi:Gamma-tubulin complex component 3-like protein [Trypanosoma cruzi]|nr:Gamma-tubulin complex component 3-like protein [Trypanosoma cruzi]
MLAVSFLAVPAATSVNRPAVGDGNDALSLVELLVELSGSLTSGNFGKYRRGEYGRISAETDGILRTASVPSSRDPTVIRRKRRRDVINSFFDSSTASTSTPVFSTSPALFRSRLRQLFQNAKQNIRQVTETHAALLELLCSAVAPDIDLKEAAEGAAALSEASEAELMLYIILRTSIAAAPTWQKPPTIPRCWLSPSITEMVERSPTLQRTMRWSCDPDPVIEAALGVDHTRYNRSAFEPYMACQLPALLTYHTDYAGVAATAGGGVERKPYLNESLKTDAAHGVFSYWCAGEKEEVRCLFSRKRPINVDTEGELDSPPHMTHHDSSVVHAPSSPGATVKKLFCSIFKEEYPADSRFCSLLFVALHRGIIGQQDPYLLLRLEGGGMGCPPQQSLMITPSKLSFSQFSETVEISSFTCPVSIGVSPELLVAATGNHGDEEMRRRSGNQTALNEGGELEAKDTLCARGVVAMLQWSCQSGTLFLRLHQLCDVSERPEWRAALGQYGKSAIEALRWLLLSLQRLVADMSDRAGGPHGVSFRELLVAQQRLRHVAEDIAVLSDVFLVHAGANWEASLVLGQLSSATLLTSLYRHYAKRTANNQWRDQQLMVTGASDRKVGRPDVIVELFLAVLDPLQCMLGAWLRAGELKDPYDEFFILPSHGATACGFLVDTSAQRLPEFISPETAEKILHAGVSLRVLRAAARHVTLCSTKEKRRLRFQAEDIDAAGLYQEQVEDAEDTNLLLREFMESLLGYRSSSTFLEMPEVSVLTRNGSLAYWRAFYAACNDVLLSVGDKMEGEQKSNVTFGSIQLARVVPVNLFDGDDTTRSICTEERGGVGGGGKAKSLVTSLSRLSRTTTAWHEAVSEELAQVAHSTSKEEAAAKKKERAALCSEYERRVLRRRAQRQLQQWKAVRLSLNMERAAALSGCVDSLLELYARMLSQTPAEEGEEKEDKMEDGRRTPIGKFVKPLAQIPLSAQAAEKSNATSEGKVTLQLDGQLLLGNEETPLEKSIVSVFRVTPPPLRRGSGSVWMGNMSLSLQSEQKSFTRCEKEPQESAHAPEMYVVADINDEEYLMERAGPSVSQASTREFMVAQYDAAESIVRNCFILSEAYQQACKEAAIKLLQVEGDRSCRADGDDACMSDYWWTNPTADEGTRFAHKGIFSALTRNSHALHKLTEEQAKSLLHCSSYYLTLSSYTASYLTHKALQVMLLGPYGTLYRLTQQFLDVCLMQSGRVADRMTGIWQRLTRTAIEESKFVFSNFMAALNGAFVEEWESCVLHGRDTLRVQLALMVPEDTSAGTDVFPAENEEENGDGAGGSMLFQDTAFRKRTLYSASEQVTEEETQWENDGDGTKGRTGDDAIPLPENPFDFISRLIIVYSTPCEGFWLLPKNAVAIYGDLFATLLFWSSVTQLVTRVWQVGIKSDVAEAFFFCNFSRAVLSAVAQHMWFLIAGFAREYRHTLRFESGVLYSYRQLESFTTDHAAFLERCRFAAMLTPAFARARRQVYGMVRQLEEVEQCLLCAARENAADTSVSRSVSSGGNEKKSGAAAAHITGGAKGRNGKKRTRASEGGKERDGGGELHGSNRRKEFSPSKTSKSSPSDVSPKVKQKPGRNSGARQLPPTEEARRRSVRNNVRRRIRSFAGLTEIFVEHLTAVRDNLAEDAESSVVPQNNEPEKHNSARGAYRTNTCAAALSSLIHTLEMTQAAVHDKF